MRVALAAMLLSSGSLGGVLHAQAVVSARAGMVHYVEGDVRIDGRAATVKFAQFPEVKENQVLETGLGRAEILLSPGAFVRVAEQSSFRMLSSRLTDIRLELLSGSMLVEVDELRKDNAITVRHGEATASLLKHGLYRFDSRPARMRVYDGKAELVVNDRREALKKGREVALAGEVRLARFDTKQGDALHRWSARRSSYIAMANLSVAHSLREDSWLSSGWRWNPYFGLMTFIPHRGISYSPFGYPFYSPREVVAIYNPRPVYSNPGFGGFDSRTPRWNPDTGYSTVGARSYGGPPPSSASPAAAAAAAGPASPRSAESASPRVSQGGGRGR